MGREWLYWVGGGARRRRRSMSADIKEEVEEANSAGCMCAVFQLFDMHQFQLPLNHQHSFHLHHFQQDHSEFKGVEAPRNSLELEETEEAMKAAVSKPLPMTKQDEEEKLNFPVGINHIKTRASSRTEDLVSDCSPGTKTPNLVARLMGLDLLPECSSPSSSNPPPKSHRHQKRCFSDDDINVGARSLPETPRTSSSSSRRSDVDHHHRLSLQINKDEIPAGKRGRRFRKQDENSSNSPGHYARQIVKQVKESVTRRVGLLDITNTNRDEHRRDQNLLIKLHQKSPKLSPKLEPQISQVPSCSPKLRFLDARKGKSVTDTGIKSPRNSSSSESCSNSSKPKQHQVIIEEDCRKVETGKTKKLLSSHKGMRKKKEEAFVRSAAKKSKKSPLSTELLHISGPTLLPIKKDPSPPATKLPLKQYNQVSPDSLSSKRNTQLSCNTSHPYRQLPDKISTVPENVLPDTTTAAAAPEFKCYVKKILKRAGIVDRFTPITLGKWHTPSHPLDPSIFYYLELFQPAAAAAVLSHRCNRKLIFQLVDELLADILRPRLDFKHWVFPVLKSSDQFALDDELCKRIESFPAANCKVLEDIDCLVDNDLCKSPLSGCYQEEEEGLVCEIEGEIVEWLVCETVGLVGVRAQGRI